MADATTDSLPTDVASLQAMVVAMREQLDKERAASQAKEKALTAERANVKALNQHIEVLKQQLAVLRRAQYGRKSEKLDENIEQLELMIEDLESSAAEMPDILPGDTAGTEKPTRRARRKPLPEHLPRDTVTHGKRESCESCGGHLVHIGDDVSEMLDYKPATFRVIRHVRPKYRCNCCECIVQAEAPGRPIARSVAGAGLLAHVAVSKFADHLAAVPSIADLCTIRCITGAVHTGRLDRTHLPASEAVGCRPQPLRDVGQQAARRRYAGTGAAAG